MVDERQYFESIGDILTQMQAEAMRAIPLGRGLIGAEITVVDLLTAFILDRDILRALVDGGRPPQVGVLRERRRPRPTTSHQPAGPIVQYAVALPGGEVKLNDEVRAALDASRGRFAAIREITSLAFIEIAFEQEPELLQTAREVQQHLAKGQVRGVALRWAILADLIDRCMASDSAEMQAAFEPLQVTPRDLRAAVASVGLSSY